MKKQPHSTAKIRILLAEDHATVREGLKLLINERDDMEVIDEAENGRVAAEKVEALDPDIVLMDVSMPDVNGLTATKRIKRSSPETKILILSRHTDDGYLQQLLIAGANGYVLKQSAPAELIRAILAVAAGEGYVDTTLTNKLISGYAARTSSLRGESKKELTARELEILRLVARGYPNKEVAERLDISIKTVEAHKSNAMRKLRMKSRIDIVRYAILQGWLEES
jgi:DNA-binding NarL/FixJ family response regulator